ncbi:MULTISPECIES: hypothetical protein [Thioclava]|uniref:COG3904 family protein n=1 Tax=Thioclava TaxID=285107 RepID=UPI000C446399|nr:MULTISPECIES: hypothetical protein [Thioclava]MAQ37829.1 hypothetical protein [Thioclava sp.]
MRLSLPNFDRFDVRRWLRVVLLVQVGIAVVMIAGDWLGRYRPQPPSAVPEMTEPVAPGDQRRRFDPARPTPRRDAPALPPGIELPSNYPDRLTFEREEVEGIGSVLLLNGAIAPGDADRLETYLERFAEGDATEEPPTTVALSSPGGEVTEALAIGRVLREAEKNTVILPGMACMSACPYVLAAGQERRVSPDGYVGMHQHYYDENLYMPAYFAVEEIQRGQGRTMEYLIDMGVDPGVMIYSLTTPPEDIYILLPEELLDSQLATAMLE